MSYPFSLGIGGKIGNGKQYFSWIHIQDAVNALIFLIENDSLSGVFNITSPVPFPSIVMLALFVELIRTRNREGLMHYGKLCI